LRFDTSDQQGERALPGLKVECHIHIGWILSTFGMSHTKTRGSINFRVYAIGSLSDNVLYVGWEEQHQKRETFLRKRMVANTSQYSSFNNGS